METTMQCKSYPLGHHFIRDCNEETQNGWSLYNEDTLLNGHFCNGFTPAKLSGYPDHSTEILKQTMLMHEALFRKQVHELHRVYGIQRHLMNELKIEDQFDNPLKAQTLQSSPASTELASNASPNSSLMPRSLADNMSNSLPVQTSSIAVNGGCMDKWQLPLELPISNGKHSGSVNGENTVFSPEDREWLVFEGRQPSSIMTSLKHEVDAGIGMTDGKETEEQNVILPLFWLSNRSNVNSDFEPVKVSLGTSEFPTCRASLTTNLNSYFPKYHTLFDLNETIGEEYHEKSEISSSNYCDLVLMPQETQGHHSSLKLNLVCPNKDQEFFQESHGNIETFSQLSIVDKREEQQEWKFFSKNGDAKVNKMLLPFEPEQFKCEKYEMTSPFYQSKKESWYVENPVCSNEASERCPSYSGVTAPRSASSVFSWRDPKNAMTHVPASTEALPCFNISAPTNMLSRSSSVSVQSDGNAYDKWKDSGDSTSHRNFVLEASFTNISFDKPNIFFCDCFTSMKSTKDMNLNVSPPNDFYHRFDLQMSTDCRDLEGRSVTPSGDMSWLKSIPHVYETTQRLDNGTAQKGNGLSPDFSQMKPANGLVPEKFKKIKAENKHFLDVLQSRVQRNKMFDHHGSENCLDVAIPDKSLHCAMSFNSLSHQESSAINVVNIAAEYSSQKVKIPSMENPTANDGLRHDVCSFRNQIDLNAVAEDTDQTNSTMVQVPPSPFVDIVAGKFALEIDLEVPAISEATDHMIQVEETLGTNQLKLVEDQEQSEKVHNATVKMTAEIIVAMASDTFRSSDVNMCESDKNSSNSLEWFADVIISHVDDLNCALQTFRGQGDSYMSSDLEDGLDFFESMTLKLIEMKEEENCVRPCRQDNGKGEEIGLASLLLTKTRKCQGKKRRQKRDFQKDILPGLSSLSRYEVNEDLETIGGLMIAIGQTWQSGKSRRSGCRNGRNWKAGRMQHRPIGSVSEVVEKSLVDPQPRQSNKKLQINEGSIMVWGRTRRCRRLRCPSGNVPASLN